LKSSSLYKGRVKYIGTPSYFLRFGGCNLKCSGFGCEYEAGEEKRLSCDTYFAVDNHFKKTLGKRLRSQQRL